MKGGSTTVCTAAQSLIRQRRQCRLGQSPTVVMSSPRRVIGGGGVGAYNNHVNNNNTVKQLHLSSSSAALPTSLLNLSTMMSRHRHFSASSSSSSKSKISKSKTSKSKKSKSKTTKASSSSSSSSSNKRKTKPKISISPVPPTPPSSSSSLSSSRPSTRVDVDRNSNALPGKNKNSSNNKESNTLPQPESNDTITTTTTINSNKNNSSIVGGVSSHQPPINVESSMATATKMEDWDDEVDTVSSTSSSSSLSNPNNNKNIHINVNNNINVNINRWNNKRLYRQEEKLLADRFLEKHSEYCTAMEEYRTIWYPSSTHRYRQRRRQQQVKERVGGGTIGTNKNYMNNNKNNNNNNDHNHHYHFPNTDDNILSTAAASLASSSSSSSSSSRYDTEFEHYMNSPDDDDDNDNDNDYHHHHYHHSPNNPYGITLSSVVSSWKDVTDFHHPPLSMTSWDQVVQSEDTYRTVCTLHHELFVASLSVLEIIYDQQQQQQFPSRMGTTSSSTSTRDGDYDDDDDSDMIVPYEITANIVPYWEMLRKERTAVINHCRPSTATSTSPSPPIEDGVTISESDNDWMDGTNKNNNNIVNNNNNSNGTWISTLVKNTINMFMGRDDSGSSSNNIPHITAHLDVGCAPNHFHFNKLIGWLYFQYIPLRQRQQRYEQQQAQQEQREVEEEEEEEEEEEQQQSNHQQRRARRRRHKGSSQPRGITDGTGIDGGKDNNDDINDIQIHPLGTTAAAAATPPTSTSAESEWLLQNRATMIQNVVDQIPSQNMLSQKIIRLLVRSYGDIGTLEASHHAERVYNRYPQHQSGLLWHVMSNYLQLVAQQSQNEVLTDDDDEAYQDDYDEDGPANNNNNNRNSGRTKDGRNKGPSSSSSLPRSSSGGRPGMTTPVSGTDRTPPTSPTQAALATRRICELLTSCHGRDRNEFQGCSVLGFQALAAIRPSTLHGYYDRVHSLGILKFGPHLWSALIRSRDHPVRDLRGGPDMSNANASPSDAAPATAAPKDQSTTDTSQVDLQGALQPTDHKTLQYLVEIYSKHPSYTGRAFDLLETAFESYPPKKLKDSFRRATFNGLIDSLKKEKQWIRKRAKDDNTNSPHDKYSDSVLSSSSSSSSTSSSVNRQLDRALRVLDKMVLHDAWSPGFETFSRLFYMAETKSDVQRVQVALELCQFLSKDGSSPFRPVVASKYSLIAWEILANEVARGNVDAAGGADPAEEAWNIYLALENITTPLFPSFEDEKEGWGSKVYYLEDSPHASIYILLLKVCSLTKSKRSLEVTMKVFDIVKMEGMLTKGPICLFILRSIANDPDPLKRLHLMKEVYMEAVGETWGGRMKKSIMDHMRSELTYYYKHHRKLYEAHLAELDIDIQEERINPRRSKDLDDNSDVDEETA